MAKSEITLPIRVDEEELSHLKGCIKRAVDGFQQAYDAICDMSEVNKEEKKKRGKKGK